MVTFKEFKEVLRAIEFTDEDQIDYARVLNNLAIRLNEDSKNAEQMNCPITASKAFKQWEIVTRFLLSKGYYDNIG